MSDQGPNPAEADLTNADPPRPDPRVVDRPRALVLVHEPDGGAAVLGRALEARGWDLVEHLIVADVGRPDDAAPFPALAGFDLVVAMGSVQSVYDTATIGSWIGGELDLLRRAHAGGVPVLGICFGGQALAAALGGRVEPAPRAEVGWYEIEGPDNPVGPGPWFEWHHDRFEPPPGADLLAATGAGPQLFRIGRSVGTQFHPEVDRAHLKGWLVGVTDAYLEELGVERGRMLAETTRLEEQNALNCRRLVDWFLDSVAFNGSQLRRTASGAVLGPGASPG